MESHAVPFAESGRADPQVHRDVEHRAAHTVHVLRLSGKDRDAPTLAEAAAAGILPTWEVCTKHYRALRNRPGTTAST